MNKPSVLVSILAYNHFDDLIETIRCLKAQSYKDFHLQVIDNASTDNIVPRLKEIYSDIDVIQLTKNRGYTGGNNVALEKGFQQGYEYTFILNDDISVEVNFLAHLIETAKSDVDCGVVGVIEEDFYTGKIRTIGGSSFHFRRARGQWLKDIPKLASNSLQVDYVQGAALLFTARALAQGIRFDEKLFMYCEEIDLGFQLREKKLKALVDLRTRVRHKYYLQRNRLYLCRKYGSRAIFFQACCYMCFIELPLKMVLRTLQGHPRFAWACVRGCKAAVENNI